MYDDAREFPLRPSLLSGQPAQSVWLAIVIMWLSLPPSAWTTWGRLDNNGQEREVWQLGWCGGAGKRGGSVLRVTGYVYLFHITVSGTLTGTGTQTIGSFLLRSRNADTEEFAVNLGKFLRWRKASLPPSFMGSSWCIALKHIGLKCSRVLCVWNNTDIFSSVLCY